MEATIEQQNTARLNEDRAKSDIEEDDSALVEKTNGESSPDITALLIFLPIAIAADVIDALDLTGIGAILARLVDLPILGILWLWRVSKTGPGRNYTFQMLLSFLIELSPVGMIPTWSIFVLYVYFKDTKLGKQTIGKAEKFIPKIPSNMN